MGVLIDLVNYIQIKNKKKLINAVSCKNKITPNSKNGFLLQNKNKLIVKIIVAL